MLCLMVQAQVTGRVIDSKTREALDYVNVYYDGKNVGEQTDEDGRFVIKEDSTWKELSFSSMGYQTQTIKLKDFGKNKGNVPVTVAKTTLLSNSCARSLPTKNRVTSAARIISLTPNTRR